MRRREKRTTSPFTGADGHCDAASRHSRLASGHWRDDCSPVPVLPPHERALVPREVNWQLIRAAFLLRAPNADSFFTHQHLPLAHARVGWSTLARQVRVVSRWLACARAAQACATARFSRCGAACGVRRGVCWCALRPPARFCARHTLVLSPTRDVHRIVA